MNKNINLALITIGNGDWKNIIKTLWDSLDICYEEYFHKFEVENTELPFDLTNYPIHLVDDYILRFIVSMPFQSNYLDNSKMVLLPWYEEEILYYIGSKLCSDIIIRSEYCDNIIILCGDNLDKEERKFRETVTQLCVDFNKPFLEIGNEYILTIDKIIKWIDSGENYCSYFPSNVKRIVV